MTEVILLWDKRPRSFELEKLEKAWLVSKEAPAKMAAGIKLGIWLTKELEKYPELFDKKLFEASRYAVVIERRLWSGDQDLGRDGSRGRFHQFG